MTFDLEWCRSRFPALARTQGGMPCVYLDGPAGSQVPQSVADAVSGYLLGSNANSGGPFVTSRETEAMLGNAHAVVADLLGTDDPATVVFGLSMTALTQSLSRSLATTWRSGDEVIVTRIEHDANFTPWVQAAASAGAVIREVPIRVADGTLDLAAYRELLGDRTRLVAVAAASNALGTINPVAEIVEAAHRVGAQVFVDAVHYAPHRRIDVAAWDCDFLACSAYKFFGPHVGILWGRREPLVELPVERLRPAPAGTPGRWMPGTPNHEGIAGTSAAIEYLAELGRAHRPAALGRREALDAAFAAITEYEGELCAYLLEGLSGLAELTVWGITDADRIGGRVPTLSFTHAQHTPEQIAGRLAEQGIFVWYGNYYALPVTEALGLEPDGMVRVGLLHYNTRGDVDRLLDALRSLGPAS